MDNFFKSVRRFMRDNLAALSRRGSVGTLIQKAATDSVLRAKLMQSPRDVLAQHGVKIPEGMQVEVLANTDKVFHLVLPPMVDASPVRKGKS